MSEYLIQSETLDDIVDVVNNITGGSGALSPAQIISKLSAIEEWAGDICSLLPIGGRIFYDDGDNGVTYTFYDVNNNEVVYDGTISSLANATQYTVSRTPIKDRFYVFNNEVATSKQWGKYGAKIGIDTDGIGLGKTNTLTALQQGAWEFNSIFTYITDCNANEVGGCTDWYIGSKAEQNKLRVVEADFGIAWYERNSGIYMLSSVEKSNTYAYRWDANNSYWGEISKSSALGLNSCFAMRSF